VNPVGMGDADRRPVRLPNHVKAADLPEVVIKSRDPFDFQSPHHDGRNGGVKEIGRVRVLSQPLEGG